MNEDTAPVIYNEASSIYLHPH